MTQMQDWLGGISMETIPGSIFETYERMMVPAVFAPWAQRLVQGADLEPGQRILDVACATGAVARAAAQQVGREGAVTGVDFMSGMLEVAQEASIDVDPPIEWIEGDASNMPVPDAAFDVVVCQQGLQFFPDRTAALREARRTLVPGGRVIVSVWRAIDHSPAVAVLQRAIETHAPDAAGFLPMAFSLTDRDELRGYFTEAGFSDVHIRIEVASVRFSSVGHYVATYLGATPLGGVLAGLPETTRAALVADVEASLSHYLDDDGLTFPQETHVATARK
jgi:ubiquinone/menaquinone biosynthesis C-methylase UbiE